MIQKIYFILMVSLFFSEEAFAQVNLVPNPSFEQLDSCPSYLNQIMYASPWFQTFINSSGNESSSSDLYSICCTDTFCSVPNNFEGNQIPHTGNSYAGIILYAQPTFTLREYIENRLFDSLIPNETYCIQFYISLGDNSKWAIRDIGVYFSNDSCLQVIPPFNELPYTPQIENTDTIIVKDKVNWQPISLSYEAQGGERFMTIGNFYDHNNSNIMLVGGTTFYAYYYIDDVSVIAVNTPAYAGIDTTLAIGDSVFIGRQPEIGLNEACVWYVNGNPIDTVAGFWATPNTTTTYVLEQTICGNVAYDTVTVTVQPTGLESFINQQEQFVVYPNPSNGELWIKLGKGLNDQSLIVIYDIAGRIVYQKNLLITNATKINVDLKQGTYFINIKPNNYTIKPFNDKITIIE